MERFISCSEIISSYRSGKRDFSNIVCRGGNFSDLDLRSISFRDSDLSGSSFSGSKLDGADFSNCNLQWTNFDHASLRRANFSGADLSWMKATEPIFERTNFSRANLSWAYVFKASMADADFTDARTETMVTKFSEMHEVGLVHGEDEIENSGLPPSASIRIRNGIEKMKAKIEKFRGNEEKAEGTKGNEEKTGDYAASQSEEHETFYGDKSSSIYTGKMKYGKRK